MSKKLKHILAVLLLLVFVTPTTVKLLDRGFHHHYYFNFSAKQGEVLHVYHPTCPIPGFTFAFFSIQQGSPLKQEKIFCSQVYFPLPPEPFVLEINPSSYLRAPPAAV